MLPGSGSLGLEADFLLVLSLTRTLHLQVARLRWQDSDGTQDLDGSQETKKALGLATEITRG